MLFEYKGLKYKAINDKEFVVSQQNNIFGSFTASEKNVTVPEEIVFKHKKYTVTGIENNAFFGDFGLISIAIPNSVTNIGSYAFYSCKNLVSVPSPGSLITIDACAFDGCSSLTSITLPASLIGIGNFAFFGCHSLTSVTLPASLASIGHSAFYDCPNLKGFIASPDNPIFYTVDGVLFSKDKTRLIAYPKGRPGDSYAVPDSVTSIGRGAFINCLNLISVTIHRSVTIIGKLAFKKCANLKDIYCEFEEEPFVCEGAFEGGPFDRVVHTKNRYIDMGPFCANRRIVCV